MDQVCCRVNLGFIGGPRHDAHLRNLALHMWTFWAQYLRNRLAGNHSKSANRQNQILWVRNTNAVPEYLEKHALLSVVLPAHAVSPFSLWLKKWQPLSSSTFGYTLPSMRLLQHRCIFVNMWDAQLNGLQTGAEMRRVLTALRAGHGQMQPSPNSKPPETPLVGRSLSSTFGRPRKKPTLVTRTMDSVTTQRGLCARSSDGELRAALAKTPCKDLSRHLYKWQANAKIWGPFSTIFLVTDLEDKHRRLAAATSVYSLFVVLAGALEFQLSNRAPQVARAGTVIATDYLLAAGHVARALPDTTFLLATVPEAVLRGVQDTPRIARLHDLQKTVGKLRHAARKALGRTRDPRGRRLS